MKHKGREMQREGKANVRQERQFERYYKQHEGKPYWRNGNTMQRQWKGNVHKYVNQCKEKQRIMICKVMEKQMEGNVK